DTVRQEHYVEDRFDIRVSLQTELAKALADAGKNRFRLSAGLAREFVSHAYLGQLDVNPVSAPGGKGRLKHCEFWARTLPAEENGRVRLRIEGKSEAAGASGAGCGGECLLWQVD